MSRPDQTPYWLSLGLRPFFFLGALAMALSVLTWIPVLLGLFDIPTAFTPRDWHVHTMLFGGVPAIIAGFALTAVSNWTGRPPVAGRPLLALILLWIAGRVAVSTSLVIGPVAAAAIDVAFPMALAGVFAHEVVASGNWRNLRIVALVGLLALADLCFHVESLTAGAADYAMRAAVAIVLLMIMLIGGRIIPAFTRNWLNMRRANRLPAGFSRLDGASMLISTAALVAWIVVPEAGGSGWLLAVAAVANAARLARWCGGQTTSEPLLFILHVAYATIPAGFALLAAAVLVDRSEVAVAAVHVWTAGTVGMMTLAVMTRASRGHSGHPLAASGLDIAIYALVLFGAASRVAAAFAPQWATPLFEAAAISWAMAYLLFAGGYFRTLFKPWLPQVLSQ